MAAVSDEAQIFFHYDHTCVEKEEDDPKDAILFYYPQSTNDDTQCGICGQLMGVLVSLTSLLGAPPSLFTLTYNKFAVKHLQQYSLVLGGAADCPDNVLQLQLDSLYDVFRFYQHSIQHVLQRSGGERKVFVSHLQDLWNSYLAFVRRYDNTLSANFSSVPSIQLPKSHSSLILYASQLLQHCQRHYPLLAGCVLYQNSRLYSQLPMELTFRLLLVQPNQQSVPYQEVHLDFEALSGIKLLKVYVTQDEFRDIRNACDFDMNDLDTLAETNKSHVTSSLPSNTIGGDSRKEQCQSNTDYNCDKTNDLSQGHLEGQYSSDGSKCTPLTVSDQSSGSSGNEATSLKVTNALLSECSRQKIETKSHLTTEDVQAPTVIPESCVSEQTQTQSYLEENQTTVSPISVSSALQEVNEKQSESSSVNGTADDKNFAQRGPLASQKPTNGNQADSPLSGGSILKTRQKGLGGSSIAEIMKNVIEKAARGNSAVAQQNAPQFNRSFSADSAPVPPTPVANEKTEDELTEQRNKRFSRSLSLEKIRSSYPEADTDILHSKHGTKLNSSDEVSVSSDPRRTEIDSIDDTKSEDTSAENQDRKALNKNQNMEPVCDNVEFKSSNSGNRCNYVEAETQDNLVSSSLSNANDTEHCSMPDGSDNYKENASETEHLSAAECELQSLVKDTEDLGHSVQSSYLPEELSSNTENTFSSLTEPMPNSTEAKNIAESSSDETALLNSPDNCDSTSQEAEQDNTATSMDVLEDFGVSLKAEVNDADRISISSAKIELLPEMTGSTDNKETSDEIDNTGDGAALYQPVGCTEDDGQGKVLTESSSPSNQTQITSGLDGNQNKETGGHGCETKAETAESEKPDVARPEVKEGKPEVARAEVKEGKPEVARAEVTEGKTEVERVEPEVTQVVAEHGEELREMQVYVQCNQDLQVMFFVKPGATLDQHILHKLWKDILSALAAMDVQLKTALDEEQHDISTHAMNYKYLNYNSLDRTLTGHVTSSANSLQAISAEENHFCDTAVMLHDDFRAYQNLHDITLRNSSSVVYGHRRAAQEVYFRRMLGRLISSAPSEKDAMLLMDSRTRDKMLQDHNNLVI